MKAVFLDRDGTINIEVDYLSDIKQFRLIAGSAQAIRKLNKLGYLVIVISNQPVVAYGMLNKAGVDKIHNEMLKRLARNRASIDAIYYCPHHPKGKIKKYSITCQCRKPGIELIKRAKKNHKIDSEGSYFIGDRTGDILAGRRAGLKTILLKTGYGGKDNVHKVKPDQIANNLYDAAMIIKNNTRP